MLLEIFEIMEAQNIQQQFGRFRDFNVGFFKHLLPLIENFCQSLRLRQFHMKNYSFLKISVAAQLFREKPRPYG